MGEETAFKTFVEEEFETHYVPNTISDSTQSFRTDHSPVLQN